MDKKKHAVSHLATLSDLTVFPPGFDSISTIASENLSMLKYLRF